jgi:hypothetical protein
LQDYLVNLNFKRPELKMRVLVLPDIPKYEMLYEGLLTATTKGAETRTLSRILTKMEEVGTKKLREGKETLLYTCATVPIIYLEESEFEFVKKKLDEVEWNGLGAKAAGQLLEWLAKEHPTDEEYRKSQVKGVKAEG